MNIEAKIQNPICIKLSKDSNVLLSNENYKKVYSLNQGIMFQGFHYGFILIAEQNGIQKELVYPTQCKIEAVGLENNHLKIFEQNKKNSWIFDKSCKLEHSPFNEFSNDYINKLDIFINNYNMFAEQPRLEHPLQIKISMIPEESMVLKDQLISQNYPLNPGVMFGTNHYGFILINDTNKGRKEVVYPTQNKIVALGIENSYDSDLKIYEEGKFHPWIFSYDGKFKKQSLYNPYSKRDKKYVEENYNLCNNEQDEIFTLQKKNYIKLR